MASTRNKAGTQKSGGTSARRGRPVKPSEAAKAGASEAAKAGAREAAKAGASEAAKAGASKAAKAGASKGKAAKAGASKAAKAGASKARVLRPAKTARPAKSVEASASQKVALAIAEAALDKKAVNVEIIDVAGKVDYADYIVVMSGTSDRQVSALARGISDDVEKKTRTKCLGVEGLPGGAWVLMDFGDVVVHIFHHDVRGYYDLESLWIDAARVPVPGAVPG